MTTMIDARNLVLIELKHRRGLPATIRHLQHMLAELLTEYQVEMAVKNLVKTADVVWNIDGVYLPQREET